MKRLRLSSIPDAGGAFLKGAATWSTQAPAPV
jgi:hypothetical protein